MKFSVAWRPSVPASASPWRVLDERGREVAWANTFLDAQRVRQLSLRSLRAYAYDLLHFARWGAERPPLSQTTESTLLDYARHQLDQQPKPAPQTIIIAWECCVVCTASITDRTFPAASSTSSASIGPDPRSATARRTEP